MGAKLSVYNESVEHRVILNSERERYSYPFFLIPPLSTMVEPLEELANKKNRTKYRAYNCGGFISNRSKSNFQKQKVENLQINDFKISEWAGLEVV